jgi:histidinol dehydrogenase
MQLYNNPPRKEWDALLARPNGDTSNVRESVREILMDVRMNGDKALRKYTKALDGVELDDFRVKKEEMLAAESKLDPELKKAIQQASENIGKFHKAQMPQNTEVEVMPGLVCSQKSVPVEKIGIYIPGGTAPLFSSVLMLAVPARIAGCRDIVLVSPPGEKGEIDPSILYAASMNGIEEVYRVGGAQAVAALAYGTDSIPRVDKIFGPGNQYVTYAKQFVNMEGTAIDMPAGPSEVLVIADKSTPANFVAADLLAQAEHGKDSQVILLTKDEKYLEDVQQEINTLLEDLPRKDIAKAALDNSKLVVLDSDDALMEMSNLYAPEHLILATENADDLAEKVRNAGSVFVGPYTPESLGDYSSGTNHVLPTNGFARAYEGVNLDAFMKKITFQKATKEGLGQIGQTTMTMAASEKLEAHRLAVEVRLNKIKENGTG